MNQKKELLQTYLTGLSSHLLAISTLFATITMASVGAGAVTKAIFFLLCPYFLLSAGAKDTFGSDVVQEMAYFARNNSDKSATLACEHSQRKLCHQLSKSFSQHFLVPARSLTMREYAELSDAELDFSIFVLASPEPADLLDESIDLIADGKVQSSLLYFKQSLSIDDWDLLRQKLSNLRRNSHFYIASGSDTVLHWHRAITLNHQNDLALNEIGFVQGSHVVKDEYDLQGMVLTSISLDWNHYVIFEDCDNNHLQCKSSSGLLVDAFELLGSELNFTAINLQGQEGWGIRPVEGPFNFSGTWVGVLGDVINGHHPVSLSAWFYVAERDPLIDLVVTHIERPKLILTPKPAEFDPGLFVRPFTDESWDAIFLVAGLIAAALLVTYLIFPNYEERSSFQIAITTSWYFFVLLNAFYGGALTMFFASEVSIPFEGMRDVIRAFPDWKLIIKEGNEVVYLLLAEQGDPDFVAFYDRLINEPSETTFSTMRDGLELIEDERAVIHFYAGLQAFYRENPFHQQELKIFGQHERPYQKGIIFSKNSPLKPVFKKGVMELIESGTYDRLTLTWAGREIKSSSSLDTMILSPGQVSLAYVWLSGLLFIAAAVLGLEVVWAALRKRWGYIKSHGKEGYQWVRDTRMRLQEAALDAIF